MLWQWSEKVKIIGPPNRVNAGLLRYFLPFKHLLLSCLEYRFLATSQMFPPLHQQFSMKRPSIVACFLDTSKVKSLEPFLNIIAHDAQRHFKEFWRKGLIFVHVFLSAVFKMQIFLKEAKKHEQKSAPFHFNGTFSNITVDDDSVMMLMSTLWFSMKRTTRTSQGQIRTTQSAACVAKFIFRVAWKQIPRHATWDMMPRNVSTLVSPRFHKVKCLVSWYAGYGRAKDTLDVAWKQRKFWGHPCERGGTPTLVSSIEPEGSSENFFTGFPQLET